MDDNELRQAIIDKINKGTKHFVGEPLTAMTVGKMENFLMATLEDVSRWRGSSVVGLIKVKVSEDPEDRNKILIKLVPKTELSREDYLRACDFLCIKPQ